MEIDKSKFVTTGLFFVYSATYLHLKAYYGMNDTNNDWRFNMKLFYIVLGCASLALGTIGAVLPFVPSFPFLLLAAYLFTKSSKRLNDWFVRSKLYKENLESFVEGRGMTWKTKIRIICVISVTMGIAYFLMESVFMGQMISALIWLIHILYFLFGIKTESTESQKNYEHKASGEQDELYIKR